MTSNRKIGFKGANVLSILGILMKIDETDLTILSILRENSDLPIREMAKKVGVHPNTLLQRIKRFEKNGILIKKTAEIDYSKLGYDLMAIIMIRCRKGRAGDMEQLKDMIKIKEFESVYATTGTYDLIVTCRVENRDQLLDIIKKVGTNPIVTRTITNLVLFTYKQPYEYNPFKV